MISNVMRQLKRLRRFAQRNVSAEFIEGERNGYEGTISAFLIGRSSTADYLLNSYLDKNHIVRSSSKLSRSALRNHKLANTNANVSIVRNGWVPRSSTSWRIPDSVASVVTLDDAETVASRQNGNSDNLRRIRKHGLYPTVSHDYTDLAEFIERAYLPYTKKRFGDLALPHSTSTLERHFGQGGLLWVEKDQKRLAAMLYSISNGVAVSRVMAPAVDGREANRLGAVGATYKFLIDLALKKGCSAVHLGASRPQLLDGVLLHKKHWGASLTEPEGDRTEWHLSWRTFTDDVADWLHRTPLLVRDVDGLSALTAISPKQTSAEQHRHLKRLWSPGLRRIHVVGESSVRQVNDLKSPDFV